MALLNKVVRLEMLAYAAALTLPLVVQLVRLPFAAPLASIDTELRPPAPWPGWPKNADEVNAWPAACEAYVNDHFGGRAQLITLDSFTKYPLGASVSPEVSVGRDGWLFLRRSGNVFEKYRGLRHVDPGLAADYAHRFASWQAKLARQGVASGLVIVPNKHTIYPQYLPRGWTRLGPATTDQWVPAFTAAGVRLLDLRPVLAAAAGQSNRLVYDRFNTHWNDLGSFAAYSAIVQAIKDGMPNVPVLQPADVHFNALEGSGDLARMIGMLGRLREPTWAHSTVTNSAVVAAGSALDYEHEGWVVTTRHTNAPRALIFCDSFVQVFMHVFLRESFSYSYFIHHACIGRWPELVAAHRPDIVLFIAVERLMPEALDGLAAGQAPPPPL